MSRKGCCFGIAAEFKKREGVISLLEGFDDFERADHLAGEWLSIAERRKIRRMSRDESIRILAYAYFRKGRIEGNYESYTRTQKWIGDLLGITPPRILSGGIPTP